MEPQRGTIDTPFHTRRKSNTFHLGKTALRVRVYVQAVGLNAEAKKTIGIEPTGRFFS
jgi:hypothetical protein